MRLSMVGPEPSSASGLGLYPQGPGGALPSPPNFCPADASSPRGRAFLFPKSRNKKLRFLAI